MALALRVFPSARRFENSGQLHVQLRSFGVVSQCVEDLRLRKIESAHAAKVLGLLDSYLPSLEMNSEVLLVQRPRSS